MSHTETKVLTVFAPAKINLYLHITGRLDNGYHSLDSLIAFADIGDEIEIAPAPEFSFKIEGPYAGAFNEKERDSSPDSSNLIVQAAWSMARAAQKVPNFQATLKKNLPLASGLGGGSADAAALIWGLLEWWDISPKAKYLPGLLSRLGADVPACLNCRPARVRGIGDVMDPVPDMGEVPVVLINPGKACPTAKIFSNYCGRFKEPQTLPDNIHDFDPFVRFLASQNNDLMPAARDVVPGIENILSCLERQKSCRLARMSGSGATCYGLFEHEQDARKAARTIAEENPDWWVKSGWLNRPARY